MTFQWSITFSSSDSIWLFQMNQCVFPAFFLGIATGSGLQRKLALAFHYSPAHTKLVLVPKLFTTKKILTGQRFFLDEARNALLAQTGYTGLLSTSLTFVRELSSRCVNSTPTHILQNVWPRMCPTNNTGPRWMNDLITQWLLRLPEGRHTGALALCLQNSTRGRTILKALSWPKWMRGSLSVASTVNFPTYIGAQKCQVIWRFYKSSHPKISLLPSHVCSLLLC